MQKKNWLLFFLLIFSLSTVVFLFFWRKIKLQQGLTSQQKTQDQESITNHFPIQPISIPQGKELIYLLNCQIESINQYRNYQQAPLIPGNWRVLADIACSYSNVQQEVEIIHLPLYIYNAEQQKSLLVGATMQTRDESFIKESAQIISLNWYETMTDQLWKNKIAVGETIEIDLSYPAITMILEKTKTKGAAFETLLEPSPPYTKEDLNNFHQTGDAQFLPKVDGKYYFWPIVGYSLK